MPQLQGQLAIGQHLVDADLETVLRLGVEAAVMVVLRGGNRDLALRGAVPLHVPGGLHGVSIHEHRSSARIGVEGLARLDPARCVVVVPLAGVQLVDAALEDLQRAAGIVRNEGFLDAHRQRQLDLARQDVLPGAMKRLRGRGAARLDIDQADALGKQSLAHQRRETDLATNVALSEGAHAAITDPGHADLVARLQPRVGQHVQIDLAGEILG